MTATVIIPCLSLVLGVIWFSNGLVQKHILLSYLCQSFRDQPLPICDSKMTVHATRLPLQIQKMKCAWNSETFKLALTPYLKSVIILAENYWLLVVGTVCTLRDLWHSDTMWFWPNTVTLSSPTDFISSCVIGQG